MVTMNDTPDEILYEGVVVDIRFGEPLPRFGDLFLVCGMEHPKFPPSGAIDFSRFDGLQITQVDDYFGVRSLDLSDEGDDVAVWLYPIVDDQAVYHHPGPFDGIRLEYCVLRSPAHYADHFLKCVEELSQIGVRTEYRNAALNAGTHIDLDPVRRDIGRAVSYWADRGITVGSDEALSIDF